VRNGISYYPWGEEKTSPPTQDGQVKFATYFRDMPGQDYADQRYYNQNAGRFYTPDPKGMNAMNLKNPTSWNMYAYAVDDPVNHFDPSGLDYCDPNFGCFYDPLGFDESAASTGPVGPVYSGDCAVLAFGEAPGVPCIYDGMGGVVPGPPTASAPPTCEETETAYVSAYLAQRSSPLAVDASLIVTYSDTKGIDDEFIVALAGAESSGGKSQQISPTCGFYNAFSNAAHCQALAANSDCYKINPYNSYEDAITDAINLLTGAKYFGNGLVTVGAIYQTYNRVPVADFLASIYKQLVPTATVNSKVNFSRCP
jgi:RHS repeat-associated protein